MLSRERILRVAIVVLAVNAVLYGVNVARGTFPRDAQGTLLVPDLLAHLAGARLVQGGPALYDPAAQAEVERALSGSGEVVDYFLSPPLAAYLYVPLRTLSFAGAAVVWTLASLALLSASLAIVRSMVPSVALADWKVFVIAFAASQPTIQILGSGQDTAVTLLLWCAGTRLALAKRDGWAGATFALGLFKPQLFVLPPLVLLVSRRWRGVAVWAAVAAATGALTCVAVGGAGVRAWLRLLASSEYVDALHAGRALRMGSVVPLIRSIAPPSLGAVADAAGAVLCAVVVGVTLARVARTDTRSDERVVWALAATATLLVTPHLFLYDLALLALPVGLLLGMDGAFSARARGALVAVTLLTWTAAARAPLESARWPVRLLAAAWTAVPLLVLWADVASHLSRGRPPERAQER